MYLGKTIEDTVRRARWQYFMKCFIINNTISFKFTEIGNQTVLSRLRWVMCKFFKFSLIRDQLVHFVKVIKLVYDDNSIALVWFRDDDAIVIM